jgi:hypothetical protein
MGLPRGLLPVQLVGGEQATISGKNFGFGRSEDVSGSAT